MCNFVKYNIDEVSSCYNVIKNCMQWNVDAMYVTKILILPIDHTHYSAWATLH